MKVTAQLPLGFYENAHFGWNMFSTKRAGARRLLAKDFVGLAVAVSVSTMSDGEPTADEPKP